MKAVPLAWIRLRLRSLQGPCPHSVRAQRSRNVSRVDQVIQIVGALLILAGFLAAQFRVLDTASVPYLLVNLVGGAVLTAVAYAGQQWGFFILEGVWTVVSAWGLVSRRRRIAR